MKDLEIIPDHIFGDLDQPEVSVPWLISHYKGVHHYNTKCPSNPRPNERVCLDVTTTDERLYRSVHVWYSTDEWVTQQQVQFERKELVWDTLRWDYRQHWQAQLPEMPKGTMLRYKIAAFEGAAKCWVFADNQKKNFSEGTNYSIWYEEDQSPEFVKNAIVYQAFPDRFNPGTGLDWLQTENVLQPCGGTLKGVTEKLDHIQGLGFNTVWLTPIFDSPSHHGYDTRDYYTIHPRLGTGEDLERLVEEAHKRGMLLVLDFVANHCSDQLPQFLDAQSNPNSPYHNWFTWQDWPNDYKCFYDVRSMPEFDLAYGSPARSYLLDCARYWLKMGIDGFRLDYAHGPEQDFWVDFRRACREINPDCWLFGEINRPADVTASFAGGLDGALDFHLCQMLRLTFAQQTWCLSQFVETLKNHFAYFGKDFQQPAFIDNHDINRFLVPAHGDERLLKIALMVLYVLPGQPIVYYGTETGLSQRHSIHGEEGQGFDEARLPMNWAEDSLLGDYLRLLSLFRQNHPGILDGSFEVILCDDQREVLVLKIGRGQQTFILLINRSENIRTLELAEIGEGVWFDGLTGEKVEVDQTSTIELDAVQSLLLIRQ